MWGLAALAAIPFPLSKTRHNLMAGFQTFVDRLISAHVVGELWIDGSFLTEKIDPKDIDVVLRVGAGIFNDGLPEQIDAIRWVIENQKTALGCDSYVLMEYHASDAPDLQKESEWWRAYWHARWGFNDEGDPKGIAVISIPSGAL